MSKKLESVYLACKEKYERETVEFKENCTLVEYIQCGYAFRDDNAEDMRQAVKV